MGHNTAVILGGGGVGKMFSVFFQKSGLDVKIVDRTEENASSEIYLIDLLDPPLDGQCLFEHAVVVVLALPENVALNVIPWVAKFAPSNVLVVSACSVQEPFYKKFRAESLRHSVIGLNPMYSPSLGSSGRPMALCVEEGDDIPQWLENILVLEGVKLMRFTPKMHDELMAKCQALPHVVIMAFGLALARSDVELETIFLISPPPMRALIALLSRILVNPVEVYWDIQWSNSNSSGVRKKLIESLASIDSMAAEGDFGQFVNALNGVAVKFGRYVDEGSADCEGIFGVLSLGRGN
jgi:prephenate dehydrogenase